jgi:ABC-2 type transport system ATP-binding protein
MTPGAVVSARELTKTYGRGTRGVVELTFDVDPGEVFGYLGPNGAGKTTTIRTMLDLIAPTSGRIEVLGLDSRRDSTRIHRRIGYLPGELALYERMTAAEYLGYVAALRGGIDDAFAAGLADRLDLDPSVPIRSLSHGNRQKVGLVQAFMHRPDLLVLDEPTQGLDPLVQQTFYEMVTEVRDDGRAVFLSSHVMPEVERLCDRAAIIREGRLVAIEDIGDLKSRSVRTIELHFADAGRASAGERATATGDGAAPVDAFSNLPGVQDVHANGSVLRLRVTGSVDPIIKTAARFDVVDIQSHEPSLEDVFLAFYGRSEGA